MGYSRCIDSDEVCDGYRDCARLEEETDCPGKYQIQISFDPTLCSKIVHVCIGERSNYRVRYS